MIATPLPLFTNAGKRPTPIEIDYSDVEFARPGSWATIWGIGFGAHDARSKLFLGSEPVTGGLRWGPDRIDFIVPLGFKTGTLRVQAKTSISDAIRIQRLIRGRTYYVDVNHAKASDRNRGSSADAPWRTLGRALEAVKPGDTVMIGGGTYPESLKVRRSGTAEAPILFKAVPGERVVIMGSKLDWPSAGIELNAFATPGLSYVNFSGLKVAAFQVGVSVRGFVHDCNFYDVEISNCQVGLQGFQAERFTFGRSRIYSNSVYAVFLRGCENFTFADCSFFDNRSTRGVAIYADEESESLTLTRSEVYGNFAGGVDLRGSNLLLTENYIYGNGGDAIRMGGSGIVCNSVLWQNEGRGIFLTPVRGGDVGQVILNCTIAGSKGGPGIEIESGVHAAIQNSIIVGGEWPAIVSRSARTNVDLDHVVVQSNLGSVMPTIEIDNIMGETGDSAIHEIHEIAGQPIPFELQGAGRLIVVRDAARIFSDYEAGDLRLSEESPARDFGAERGAPLIDISRWPRLYGGPIDAGAFELLTPNAVSPSHWLSYE